MPNAAAALNCKLQRPRVYLGTRRSVLAAVVSAAFVFGVTAALARSVAAARGNAVSGTAETILIAQIALLLLVGRGLGEIMQRLGQPSVIGQLLAGIVLGPSLFAWVMPAAHHLIFPDTGEQKSLIAGISNIGVMMLLLLTGMETDMKLVRRVGAPALAVAAAGVAVPVSRSAGTCPHRSCPTRVTASSRLSSSAPPSRFPPSRSWR
jgi:hypothetical protein